MWLPKNQLERKGGKGSVAVAVDRDKNSQNALKWAIDNLLQRGKTVVLIHVKVKSVSYSSASSASSYNQREENCKEPDAQTKEMLLPFRCFCLRKDIQCKTVMLEGDVAKALTEYVSQAAIENLVLGASSKNGFLRFKATDIPSSVGKGAPDFCNVYVIAKGKIQSRRPASRPAPADSPLHREIEKTPILKSEQSDPNVPTSPPVSMKGSQKPREQQRRSYDEMDSIRSPISRRGPNERSRGELSMADSDISFIGSGRPSADRVHPLFHDNLVSVRTTPRNSNSTSMDLNRTTPRNSNSTDMDLENSFESSQFVRRSPDSYSSHSPSEFSSFSQDSDSLLSSSQTVDDVEAEMRRLKLELKQTMEMYSTACREALQAKQKAMELQQWKREEEKKLEEARLSEEAAIAIAEKERAKSKAAIEAAEAAKKIADLEAQKRISAEQKALKEAEERKKAFDAFAKTDMKYRKYSIDEIEAATGSFQPSQKIGEGGYGPVYKCYLDHTAVAIKVLRPDAAQGRSQFQREVEILSCIRHPNMVLLLGACPEYGCLVYEFMANGSLEDRLFRRGNTPPLSWQMRFRIAAEIGTGLLFLHQSKPKPLVHRDLKPANILLDRNFVSKISDVGLARLVPSSHSDNKTQYHMTSTAGTFCYIDPEYQQTGMLGVKSDIYSLGIMFLQMITARSAMGLTHHVERAIVKGTFAQMLDPAVPDWPVDEALSFVKLSLKCAELRKKDRPDLATVVLPELNRLRAFAEDNMQPMFPDGDVSRNSNHSQVSVQLEHSSYAGSNASSRSVSTTVAF